MSDHCPHGWSPWINCEECLDARVAAAERKGMERAMEIAANFDEKDCYGSCADAIRAEMEADDG